MRDYHGSRSEAAFAELVRRHVDIVYSAALRMVRDTHLAEDVTQGVFVALAQNARPLIERPVLSGWLHRTAQNLAANAVRTDVRRRAREQEAAAMNELLAGETEAAWEHIAPHLDAALGELSDSDRDALLLRYFERKSAQEMAQVLGVSDDAAQKRVSRAVERLREFLAKRGVTVGASGLVVIISTNAVLMAPAGLSAAITAIAIAGTTIATTAIATATKAIAMTTLQKTFITAALAAAIGTGIYEAREAAHSRAELQVLRQSLAEQSQQAQRERDEATARLSALADENDRLKNSSTELLRLRGEVTRLRGLEAELAKQRELNAQLEKQHEAGRLNPIAMEEAIQKFEAQRARTINALKQVGLQLRLLERNNNAKAAFAADGNLNPNLLANSLPNFDLKQVELLVSDPSQLSKLLEEQPGTIVARTLEPIATPDGRWLRVYTQADGSVQTRSTENPNEAFDGEWHLGQVKSKP